MGIGSTAVLYLMLGGAIAGSVLLKDDRTGEGGWFRLVTACLFWPLYLPLLLSTPEQRGAEVEGPHVGNLPQVGGPDEMDRAIGRVEAELEAAVRTLDGWAERTLANERERLEELRQAWRTQAERIRELTRLIDVATTDTPELAVDAPSSPSLSSPTLPERVRESERARLANVQRLRSVRRQMYDDLMGTLAWVRELVTMIHLAKYTGAPASRAEELVAQIAAAVEGLTEARELAESPGGPPLHTASALQDV